MLALEATELLGLMTCVGWTDLRNPGLSVTPRKAGLAGEIARPGLEARAGLDSLAISHNAGLDTEFLTFIILTS